MLVWFILAFLILPALEITVFIWIGGYIGPWWVFALIVLTGLSGVAIARRQGIETWNRLQNSFRNQTPPGDHIIDGICIILGGILLFMPGFVTDIFGFFFVLPITRKPLRALVKLYIYNRITKGKITYRKF